MIFLSVGALIAALVCVAAVALGGVITITTIVFIVVPAALAALGARLAFRHDLVIEVDLNQRRYSVIREGKPTGSGPLDDLGPLAVSRRTRVSGGSDDRRTVVEYVVNPAVHSKIDFHVLDTPGRARRKMEDLARAWQLPCRSLGGAVRAAKDLDVPLHERLRDDREAMVAAPLRPEWSLRIEPIFRGHAIVSTHRSWAPLAQSAFIVLAPLVVLWMTSSIGLVSTLREASGDLLDRVLLALLAVIGVALLGKLWQGMRDTFFPGAIHVNERGVSYRGSRMRYREIEEVTANIPIEIVGDRRILSLPASFCPPAAVGPLAHELQRLILEVAPRASLPVR